MNSIEVQKSLDFYKVVEIKGKGMGCIALKDIERHSALKSVKRCKDLGSLTTFLKD